MCGGERERGDIRCSGKKAVPRPQHAHSQHQKNGIVETRDRLGSHYGVDDVSRAAVFSIEGSVLLVWWCRLEVGAYPVHACYCTDGEFVDVLLYRGDGGVAGLLLARG